jgi:hypothetical protein
VAAYLPGHHQQHAWLPYHAMPWAKCAERSVPPCNCFTIATRKAGLRITAYNRFSVPVILRCEILYAPRSRTGGALLCQRSQRYPTTHESERREAQHSRRPSQEQAILYRYDDYISNQPPASNSAIRLSNSGTPLSSTSNSSFSSSSFNLFSASSFAKTCPPWPSNCRIQPW